MTGWHLRAGYSSTALRPDVEMVLDRVVEELRRDVAGLTLEVRDGRPGTIDPMLGEVIARYPANDDLTLTRHENLEEGVVEWMVLASGSGPYRTAKEIVARAFVRRVLREMHRHGLDVTVVVA